MDCFCKKKNILKSSKILSNQEKLARIRQMKNDKNVTIDLMKLKIKTNLYNTLSEFKALSRKTCLTPEICLYIQNKYKNTTFNKRLYRYLL